MAAVISDIISVPEKEKGDMIQSDFLVTMDSNTTESFAAPGLAIVKSIRGFSTNTPAATPQTSMSCVKHATAGWITIITVGGTGNVVLNLSVLGAPPAE